jgi:DNA polymerase-3 subunit epsilon
VLTRIPPSGPSTAERSAARRAACRWAAEILNRPGTVFVDTETTGLDVTAEIVDLAIVDGVGGLLFETLVRPDGPIPADATNLHGIDDGMVAGAPRWHDVYPHVAGLLAGRTVVVYNADFDFRMVNQMNARSGLPPRADRWECAMRQYGAFAAEWNAKYGNYRWHRLEVALGHFGHPASTHRALADARACRLVVQGMASSEC